MQGRYRGRRYCSRPPPTQRQGEAPPRTDQEECYQLLTYNCDYCRQAHGAALVTWVAVQENQFRIADGEDLITWYASSKQGRRGFCSRCGSTMFYQSSLCPEEVHITLANVKGGIDHKPSAHVFFDSHVDWLSFDDDLLRLDTNSEFLAQFKAVRR